MLETLGSDFINIFGTVLAIGVAWIILRLVINLARRIFQIGCVVILILGVLLIVSQYLQGV